MKFTKIIFIFFILLLKTKAHPLGSLDTTLSGTDKSQFINVPWTFDPGTYAKGYVTFNNGFSLAADMTFECNGIVSGDINLNNHNLYLYSDFYLGKAARIVGPGSIWPNGRTIYLLDQESITGGDVHISNPGTIVGNGNTLILDTANGGALHFPATFTEGSLHNLFIRNVNNTSFTTVHTTGYNVNFDGVSLEITTNNYVDLNWNITVFGHCQIIGINARINSCGTTAMASSSSWEVLSGATFRIAPSFGGIFFTDATSEFILNNATLETTWSPGNYFNTPGNIVINGVSKIRSLSGTPFYFGDGISPSNDPNLIIHAGSTLLIDNNTVLKYQCIQ